jgi:hypothetical protein
LGSIRNRGSRACVGASGGRFGSKGQRYIRGWIVVFFNLKESQMKISAMKTLAMMTTAVGLCLAAPAFGQTAADQKGLVTVNLQDVLNNLSADLKVDRANIPVTAQIPINAAANVCGVSVNVLSAQAATGPANCSAKTGSQQLTQAVQQQMAAGGTAAGQSGTTAAVSNPPASSTPAANTAASTPAANTAASTPAANTAASTPAANTAASTPAANTAATTPAANTASPSTAANAPAATPGATAQGTQAPAAAQQTAQTAPSAATQAAPAQSAQTPAASGTANTAAQPASATALAPQQQSQIAELITKENIKPAAVAFPISQGMAVPATVTLSPVPASVITLAPQYRGYSYFATTDKVVIVEPAKKTVVAIIPMGNGARAQSATTSTKSVSITKEQQDVIRKRMASPQKKVTTSGSASGSSSRVTVRQEVPASVKLEDFDEEVVRDVPTVRSYKYYRQDDDVVIVDPGERRVIEVIR